MKIISWDVRGARRRGIYSQVRDLISIFNPDILVCMETRVNFGRALKIIKKITMPTFLEISPSVFLGGIWFFWKDKIDFQITV